MMPLHPAFRRMLLSYIPQLKSADLDKYDGLLALYNHRKVQFDFFNNSGGFRIKKNSTDMNHVEGVPDGEPEEDEQQQDDETELRLIYEDAINIIKPVRKQYEKAYRQWQVRSEFASVQQAGVQPTFGNIYQYIKLMIQFYYTCLTTSFVLLLYRWLYLIRHFTNYQIIAIVIIIGMLIMGFRAIKPHRFLESKRPIHVEESTFDNP
ncbi:hypothetical protein JW960_09405 [candidate division KSB1 bacterium]|nr:hypothetical protein [candidate division KSB1 bacterium]